MVTGNNLAAPRGPTRRFSDSNSQEVKMNSRLSRGRQRANQAVGTRGGHQHIKKGQKSLQVTFYYFGVHTQREANGGVAIEPSIIRKTDAVLFIRPRWKGGKKWKGILATTPKYKTCLKILRTTKTGAKGRTWQRRKKCGRPS